MKIIDFNNLGGNPIDQQSLELLQDSYISALAAIAKLCGDKTILTGVVVTGGNVSAGWISYNGELVRFVAGSVDTAVLVAQSPTYNATFENAATHDEEFETTAICTSTGSFPFADLKRLDSLFNVQALVTAWIAKQAGYISYRGLTAAFDPGSGTGAITANDSAIIINIPDQGTNTYTVAGSLVGQQSDPNLDNDVMWIVTAKTNTHFVLAVSGASVVQSVRFDFAIIKS